MTNTIELYVFDNETQQWIAPLASGQELQALAQIVNNNTTIVTEFSGAVDDLETDFSNHLAQMTWYDATLINGFTGYIKYAKDAHGVVHLHYQLLNIPIVDSNVVICILPDGYRPLNKLPVPTVKSNLTPFNNALPFTIFDYDGGFYVTPNSGLIVGTNADLQGQVSYFASL